MGEWSGRGPWRERSDRELLDAAARDDDRAFAVLYHRYIEDVFVAALEELGDEDEAQQVAQQVFATAWDKARHVRLANGSALGWLLVTCRNHAANRLRSLRRRPAFEGLDDRAVTMLETRQRQRIEDRELLERVEEEISAMPALDQQAYQAVIVEGLSYDEAARRLGISVASVGKRLNRVRKRVGQRFGGGR
jgi:RNA polymerase sigma-70 factor (ECF subfamily)